MVLAFNIFLLIFPLFDIVIQVRPTAAACRRFLISAGAPPALFGVKPAVDDPANQRATDRTVVEDRAAKYTVEAHAMFDAQEPTEQVMGYLMTLKVCSFPVT